MKLKYNGYKYAIIIALLLQIPMAYISTKLGSIATLFIGFFLGFIYKQYGTNKQKN